MPANEYFRCPLCGAKLKFGKRPQARVTCPRCSHQFDYQPPEESEPTESDEIGDESVGASAVIDEDAEYGPPIAPLRPRKKVSRAPEDESGSAARKPLSKRWKKWYKRSWLSNPSTAGWQIAAGYAGIGLVIMLVSLWSWMHQLQVHAKEDAPTTLATVDVEHSTNMVRMAITSMSITGTILYLPIPFFLWIGSNAGRWYWLLVRGAGYFGALMILHSATSGPSMILAIALVMVLGLAAVSNLVGCFLLTTWEGSVGRTLFAILLIVFSESAAIGVFLTVALTNASSPTDVPSS